MSQEPNPSIPGRPRVRIILDWIEITDSMDLDSVGEFRFRFRVHSDRRGLLQEVALPEKGTLPISEDADRNHVGPLDLVLYEGPVEFDESFIVEATGEEVDLLTGNEELEPYERAFRGHPDGWVGSYTPWDETGPEGDPERRAQWRLGYRVQKVEGAG